MDRAALGPLRVNSEARERWTLVNEFSLDVIDDESGEVVRTITYPNRGKEFTERFAAATPGYRCLIRPVGER